MTKLETTMRAVAMSALDIALDDAMKGDNAALVRLGYLILLGKAADEAGLDLLGLKGQAGVKTN